MRMRRPIDHHVSLAERQAEATLDEIDARLATPDLWMMLKAVWLMGCFALGFVVGDHSGRQPPPPPPVTVRQLNALEWQLTTRLERIEHDTAVLRGVRH